jgi:hypothetical protein
LIFLSKGDLLSKGGAFGSVRVDFKKKHKSETETWLKKKPRFGFAFLLLLQNVE